MRYERPTSFASPAAPWQTAAGSLDAAILAMTGLIGGWDYDPSRVTAGTDMQFANRVSGGSASYEMTGAMSSLVLSTDGLPPGGQMRQCGVYDGTTVVRMGGTFPSASNSVWTKVVCYKANAAEYRSGSQMRIWQGRNSSNTDNHYLSVFGGLLYHDVGTVGSEVQIHTGQHAIGAWNYAIASYDNGGTTAASKLQVNGGTVITADRTSQQALQSESYFGGSQLAANYKGRIGPSWLFGGTTVATGSLFHSTRTADLAIVNAWCQAVIGRLNLVS